MCPEEPGCGSQINARVIVSPVSNIKVRFSVLLRLVVGSLLSPVEAGINLLNLEIPFFAFTGAFVESKPGHTCVAAAPDFGLASAFARVSILVSARRAGVVASAATVVLLSLVGSAGFLACALTGALILVLVVRASLRALACAVVVIQNVDSVANCVLAVALAILFVVGVDVAALVLGALVLVVVEVRARACGPVRFAG